MKVPLLDIQAQLTPLREEIIEAVTAVVDSTRYIMGPEVDELEKAISDYSDCFYGVGVSSGTDALLVSLMALDIGPGDRILTTPYSFFATMGVILRCGAQPLFADIDPVTFNIDPQQVAEILEKDTEKTIKAIMPVHLYGQCADMGPLLDLAAQYNIAVIEDAAQAIGAEYPCKTEEGMTWRKAGSMGLAGCFSFFPSKNLGGIGDGGMVVSNDQEFSDKLALLRNHGAYPKYYHEMVGGNFRLDPIQATVLKLKLKHLEQWHTMRRENGATYNKLFAQTRLIADGLVSCPQAVFRDKEGAENRNYHIYNQYVLRVERRDALKEWLLKNDIGCEVYYPVPLHRQECLGENRPSAPLPHTEKAAQETIALPIYPELTDQMQEYIVETINQFYT